MLNECVQLISLTVLSRAEFIQVTNYPRRQIIHLWWIIRLKNPVFRQKWGQISSIVGCLALCVVVAIFRVNFGDHRGLAPLENVQFFRTKMCGLRSFIRISEMMETVL